jgi:hypothetical protein
MTDNLRPRQAADQQGPTWTVAGGEGDGARPYRVGETLRALWSSETGPAPDAVPGGRLVSDRRVSGIVTVITADQRYYAEDGLSFGVGADEGHRYWATVRAATPEEAAAVLAEEAAHAASGALNRQVRDVLLEGLDDSERPPSGSPGLAGVLDLPEVPLRPADDKPVHGTRLLVDEPGGCLWTVVYHGADGDDWSANNLAGHIATRVPLTDERRRLVADLRAMYASLEAWADAGIPEEAAQVLIRAGVDLHTVTDSRVAVSVKTVPDAVAYLARSERQWSDAGWTWPPLGRRWPASDAARLADAGITCSRATELRDEGGLTTVEAILAAQPPQLPGTAGRYILSRCHLGPQVQVTDDADEAQRRLDRDPRTWAHWSHVPGITVVHVCHASQRGGWQLWSNGDLSAGHWMRGLDKAGPRSLSDAAEHVITLLVDAANPEQVRDRAIWQPLLTATAHRQHTITETGVDAGHSGRKAVLVRHDVTLKDGSIRTLWEVTTSWWALGEDGDHEESHWVSASEQAARQHYETERPKEGA